MRHGLGLSASTAWGLARGIAISLALALAGVTAIAAIERLWTLGEPVVDFEQRAPLSVQSRAGPDREAGVLVFAMSTMVGAEATFSGYEELVKRVCREAGLNSRFVIFPSYAEVRRGLEEGTVDTAFVCTGTYVHAAAGGRIKLLVQPEFPDGLDYRCLILVPAESRSQTLDDLRGATVAFTDPESNTGCLVPSVELTVRGHDPRTFFNKVIFTSSHDRSIRAVAAGLVDAAAVDSLVWEFLARREENLRRGVRSIWRSPPYGPPPVVVRQGLEPAIENALREAFLALDRDAEGARLLSAIEIKRFVPPEPQAYATAIELYRRFREAGAPKWP